jgi:hypothetical protein
VKLHERETRAHQLDIMAAAREQLRRFRALRIAVTLADDNTAETKPVQISVRGTDFGPAKGTERIRHRGCARDARRHRY